MSIKLENLNYIYGTGTVMNIQALKDINLEINEGTFVGLIGHTGSGKSTLIQHLDGLLKPTSGKVLFNDVDIFSKDFNMRDLRCKVGLVFQYPEHQLFEADIFSDVAYGPKNLGLDKEEIDRRVKDAINLVGLDESYYLKSPFELSGGEKRRAAIAGVLAMEPDYLVLDEPTAGLDPKGRDEILDQIANLQKKKKITVILVSHSMEDIAKYVERVIVMNKGEIIFDDEPKKVFANYKKLEEIGLMAPQITYVMHELKDNGIDVDKDITTLNEAKAAILKALSKGKIND